MTKKNPLCPHCGLLYKLPKAKKEKPKGYCVECNTEFTIKREHTLYCSNACSQKAYRKRKKDLF